MSGTRKTLEPESGRARRTAGFTLVELLIVTVVLGIVAAIAIVSLAGALDRAKQRATMADMRLVGRTIESYMVDFHFPPDDAGGLAALVPFLIPYQTNVLPLDDHWQQELDFTADRIGNYTVESYGRDGTPGGDIDYASRFDYDLDIVLVNGMFVASPE